MSRSARDHVLEIGTGWGGFCPHAAGRHGCHVTSTTLSAKQRALALERVASAGLSDRVRILDRDYRELEGRFDKLVSIEMVEAVGHEHLADYFRVCAERLHPTGRVAIQAIVIRDQVYESARRTVDFIKRYVFPGGCLPSVGALLGAAARASDLRLVHLEELTPHYAETLRRWRARFLENRDRIAASASATTRSGSGSSTSPTARPSSRSGTSAPCSWSSSGALAGRGPSSACCLR